MSNFFNYRDEEKVQDLEKHRIKSERDLNEREKELNKEFANAVFDWKKIVAKKDQHIAELEEENKELKKLAYCTSVIFEDGYDEKNKVFHNIKEVTRTYKELFEEQREVSCKNGKLYNENYNLKQQLHELSKKICDEIRTEIDNYCNEDIFLKEIEITLLRTQLHEQPKKICDEIIFLARVKGIFGQKKKDMNYNDFMDVLKEIQAKYERGANEKKNS